LGYACTIRHTAVLLALAVAWAGLWTLIDGRRTGDRRLAPIIALGLAYAVFPLSMLAYDALVFGSPFVTGYALSDEQVPSSWQQFFRPALDQRAPAFTWNALVANFDNLVHGLNYELMFMVFPLGLLGILFVGVPRERV